jgi:hypothetical protein
LVLKIIIESSFILYIPSALEVHSKLNFSSQAVEIFIFNLASIFLFLATFSEALISFDISSAYMDDLSGFGNHDEISFFYLYI